MVIKKNVGLAKTQATQTIRFHYNNTDIVIEPTEQDYDYWRLIYTRLAQSRVGEDRERLFSEIEGSDDFKNYLAARTNPTKAEEPVVEVPIKERLMKTLGKLINFFKEFEFEPNFRFVNTLSYKTKESLRSANDFIINYFDLVDNQYKTEIKNKIDSMEFKEILKELSETATPNDHINKRFKVYYGSAGTGKTTLAMKESDNRCVVCNASMLPSDLMEDFVFSNGQPTFQKSSLWNCMENGLPIVLDEINLLPFDSLRFLQGILDGKKEFDYKGHKVTINDGFEVIGTMNLTIGGMVYGLPEPLIDRCADMKKFSLSAEQLLGAVM